jgi:uncharacterized membrane protein
VNNIVGKVLKAGIITESQSQKIELLIKKEADIRRIGLCISIAYIFIVLSVAFFCISNWAFMPRIANVLILAFIVFASTIGGFIARGTEFFKSAGRFLVFAGAFLVGALIFLVAYSYGWQFSWRFLLIIWLIFILPLGYIVRQRSIVYLWTAIFLVWVLSALFVGFAIRNISFFPVLIKGGAGLKDSFLSIKAIFSLPIVLCLIGIFYFCIGKAHSFSKKFALVGSSLQRVGFFILCPSLLLTTFSIFFSPDWIRTLTFPLFGWHINIVSICLIVLEVLVLAAFFTRPKPKGSIFSTVAMTILIVFFFVLLITNIPSAVADIVFAATAVCMILEGIKGSPKDNFYVRVGVFWLAVFAATQYFVLFWSVLPAIYFLLIGVGVIVALVLFLSFQKRKLTTKLLEGIGL